MHFASTKTMNQQITDQNNDNSNKRITGASPIVVLGHSIYFNRESISVIFDYVRVRFYADDMKLFLPVRGFQDCIKIQSDLNKLSE
jgi:hypothetical protein